MSEEIRQDNITGSRRFSNYFWGIFLAIGGLSFLLAGLSSYFKINLLPIANPISKPRNSGVKPKRYAGKFFKSARVTADDVIGVAKCPTNGSSL
jgi:hypothetical protein